MKLIKCVTFSDPFFREAATLAKYMITFLVFSVFPAPDSPLIKKIRKFVPEIILLTLVL